MFKIGQKVVCIDVSGLRPWQELKLHKTYTIESTTSCGNCGGVSLILKELKEENWTGFRTCKCGNVNPDKNQYSSTRFKPLEEKEEKYSLLSNKEIIETITQEVPDKIKEKELC